VRRATGLAALLVLAAVALGGCEGGPREVRLEIRHSRFSTGTIEVEAGSTVRFVIANTDPIAHEFILGDQAVQDRHENGNEPRHGARPGEVSVPAGETHATTYTFQGPGTLIFACHLPGHLAYGMRGEVTVG
jgi:uncharacterized cupredoxin-like copper-binding protein